MNDLVFIDPNKIGAVPSGNAKHVYVVESATGLVKIGVSNNVSIRVKTLETQSGFAIKRVYATELATNCRKIEKEAHKHYESRRVLGEWFSADFCDAAEVVKSIYGQIGYLEVGQEPSRRTDEEIAEHFRAVIAEHEKAFTEMERIKAEDNALYDALVANGLELKILGGTYWVFGNGLEMTYELFKALIAAIAPISA